MKDRFSNWSFGEHLPDNSLEICEENLYEFFQTMFERQEVWNKRFLLKQERPWTKNPILRDYKFTNVYRELDNHSQYQIKNAIIPESSNILNLIWKIFLFRIFNQPNTFDYIKSNAKQEHWKTGFCDWGKFNYKELEEYITEVRESGLNPFTEAYLVNSMACPGQKRDYCYTNVVVPAIHKAIPKFISLVKVAKSPYELIARLKQLPAIADFIAHELYQDLTYIERYADPKFQDFFPFNQNDYTNVGPGAEIGIRLIFPNRTTNKEKLQAIYDLRDLAKPILESFGQFKYLSWDSQKQSYFVKGNDPDGDITLHQIEMWLCEYQKYWKMKIGVGKQRSKFNPKTQNL
jgi:hypothetical protein